ncbi:MAG: hypothetical protein WBD30_08530 [Bacteroidota bacterium]
MPVVFALGTSGATGKGYPSCHAVSDDLVRWEPRGLVVGYEEPGAFDHGGVGGGRDV